ncbi:Gluconate 2-dehydrogenase, membrane-bound, flavoprotein [Caballeronia glathei]|jgi:gluconate 2-dehydrogenase alpha chain|uniref:GMC family oxidoreductase n=1 Tax=Caballeronia glathei TaxID=60547 RepID=UPI00050055A6|nr:MULTISPECIES: GMC family oxidoreductase [Burkholderiaceae]TCK39346.1 gluconate 2-dehydrogenase alpha chain [Paraburkholderia sp. BL8N3]CDY78487.1 Gluconate 2-dehydrogenase, membrane-bound, flavoprotein [Caballeronia glathei]
MASIKKKPVDAVIVGFGWTGSIMAIELANAGLNVVALERGDARDTVPSFAYPQIVDEIKYSARQALLQNLAKTTVTNRHTKNDTAVPYRQIGSFKPGEGVGGAGAHWSGVQSRVMPDELRMKSHITERYGAKFIPEDMNLQDWGVTYDELEPSFDRFERVCGTSGKAGNIEGKPVEGGNPFEGRRSNDFPLPPLADHPTGKLFARAAKSLGYKPFALPAGNASGPYENEYGCQLGPCNFCGFCSDYGCLNYSKASPQTAIIPALLRKPNFELRVNAHVIKVNTDASGKRATGVTYVDAEGNEVEQPAEMVILAAFQLHNVHLMLLSKIGQPFNADTNEGVVGRNFCYQLLNSVNMFFDQDTYINPFMGAGGGGQAIEEFNADNFDHASLGFIGGGIIWGRQTGNGPVRGIPLPKGAPKWGTEWKKAVKDNFVHTGRIESQCSNMAYRGCFADLDPNYRDAYGSPLLRLTLDWQDNDLRASEYVAGKMMEIGRAMNPKSMSGRILKPGTHWDTRAYQSTHISGGTAMGADPKTSVVNKYLQSWDVPNLFVLGANVFAHGIGYNPTGLVGGLAYWAASNIRSQYLKNPGAMVQV